MNYILFFILGIVTIRYCVPLLDQCLSWLLTAIEVKKAKLLIKQQECEKAISDIAITMEEPKTAQIGFVVPTDDLEDQEGQEDEDL